jgi:hypothetical protein
MADEKNERMDADQKEERDDTIAGGFDARTAGDDDTEFAAESWMGGVLNPVGSRPAGNIEYDPDTYTERYHGERSLDDDGDRSLREATGNAENERTEREPTRAIAGDDVETSAEIAAPVRREAGSPVNPKRTEAWGGIGWTGLGLSILSLFLLPYLVAPIGMILGYMAYRRNARTLGVWAMIIGAVAILGALVIYPYYVAR